MEPFATGIRLNEETNNNERKPNDMIVAMLAFAAIAYVIMSRLDRFLDRL